MKKEMRSVLLYHDDILETDTKGIWWTFKKPWSEWLNLMAFLGTVDSEVHIVHIGHVIKAYTLESLSFLT